MSEHCHPRAREHARRAESALEDTSCVEHVELLSPDEDPSNRWTLDVTAWSSDGNIPWQILQVCGQYRLDARADPQGASLLKIRAFAWQTKKKVV